MPFSSGIEEEQSPDPQSCIIRLLASDPLVSKDPKLKHRSNLQVADNQVRGTEPAKLASPNRKPI